MSEFIYLDTERERQQLVTEIAKTRQAVLAIINLVPESEWYTPRYQDWSLAAMLGHLNLTDNLYMLLIKAALLGIQPAPSTGTLSRLNRFTAQIFRKRVIESSTTSIQKNEARIAEFIMQIPMKKFSKPVYDPTTQETITIERALQAFFLIHWQTHLAMLREVEGITPPQQSDNI